MRSVYGAFDAPEIQDRGPMIYLAEFDIQDFDWMDIKPNSWAQPSDRAMIEAYGKSGPAVTLWDDDLPICCGGIGCTSWKGIGDIWIIPSVHVNKYMKSVYKNALALIEDVTDKLGLWRIQATIKEDDPVAIRWIEHLGFEREGLMRKFGPKQENQYLYARVK